MAFYHHTVAHVLLARKRIKAVDSMENRLEISNSRESPFITNWRICLVVTPGYSGELDDEQADHTIRAIVKQHNASESATYLCALLAAFCARIGRHDTQTSAAFRVLRIGSIGGRSRGNRGRGGRLNGGGGWVPL